MPSDCVNLLQRDAITILRLNRPPANAFCLELAREFEAALDSPAVKAAKVMGLDVCGVDLLRSARGPLVLEVNSSPGLEGIEKATGKDLAGEIIRYIEKSARPKSKRSPWKG